MYWLNASRLAEDLREGRVDEKERFKYYLANFTVLSIVFPVFFYSVGPLSVDDLIYLIVSAIIGGIGIIFCCRANRSGDNIDFIPRMICLSWLWTCGFLVFCIVPFSIHTVAEAIDEFSFAPFFIYGDLPQLVRESWSYLGSFPTMPILPALYYGITYSYLVQIAGAKEGRILVERWTAKVPLKLSLAVVPVGILMFPGSIFVFAATESYVMEHAGVEIIARLVAFSAAGLWLILLGWIYALLHKRAMKYG